MGKRTYSAEYREEAVKMVIESGRPIAAIARDLGIKEGTLGNWVNRYRNEHPASEELNISDRARLKELEKEVRELRMERDFLKKSRSLLREGTMSEKYALVAAEKADPASPYRVVAMCAWLEVSTSGFYDHCNAEPSARALRRTKIISYVQAAYEVGRGTYGVRRVHAVLQRSTDPEVARVSENLVRAIMVELGLAGCQSRAYKTTTQPDPDPPTAPADLVGRDFTATVPGTKLVGDITYIRSWTGWLYLATVIDCCTREVIGWSMATHMRASLVCDAISMAVGNGKIEPDAIFHSDRGTQYTSAEFTSYLRGLDIRSSMGRRGQCWDNALAESFFASLKNELVYRTVFATQDRARRAVVEYIEVFYNRIRLHSGLGYKTPAQVAHSFLLNTVKAA